MAGTGTLVSQVLLFATLPILTRIYAPHVFAGWAVAFAAVGLFSTLATLRLDLAVITEKKDEDAKKILSLCIFIALASLVFLFLIISIVKQFGVYFTEKTVPYSVSLFILWCFVALKLNLVSAWCIRSGKFFHLSVAQIGSAILIILVQIIGGKISQGDPLFLFIGSITGALFSLSILIPLNFFHSNNHKQTSVGIKTYQKLLIKNKKYLQYSILNTIFSSLKERIPIIFLGNYVPAIEVSFYSQSKRICGAPASLIGSVLRPVFFHLVNKRKETEFNNTVLKALKIIFWVGAPVSIIVMFFSAKFFSMYLGEKWQEIGPLLSLMVIPGFLDAAVNWMDRIFDSKQRQDLNLKMEMVFGTTSLLSLFLLLAFTKNLFFAVLFQSLILSIGNLFLLFTFVKLLKIPLRQLQHLLFGALFLALATVFVCYTVKH